MSTQLFEGKNFTLTGYWGGKKQGIMYQITQYNKTEEHYDWVQLSKKDIRLIIKKIG